MCDDEFCPPSPPPPQISTSCSWCLSTTCTVHLVSSVYLDVFLSLWWCPTFRDSIVVSPPGHFHPWRWKPPRCVETSGTHHPVTRRHIPEERRSQLQRYENLKVPSVSFREICLCVVHPVCRNCLLELSVIIRSVRIRMEITKPRGRLVKEVLSPVGPQALTAWRRSRGIALLF
jgi:hypothetical protein